MKIHIQLWLLLVLLDSFQNLKCQPTNLVENGSFEHIISSATVNPFNACAGWSSINKTTSAYYLFSSSPPLENAPYASTGFQFARTGTRYILTSFFCSPDSIVWYPTSKLRSVPKAGKTYCARYFIVNTNNNRVAIQEYELHLGDESLDTVTVCNRPLTYLQPQIENKKGIITDTMIWTEISGTFVANGAEKYIVLGNFNSPANTSTLLINTNTPFLTNDIYIDDVSIVEMELPAFAGRDTSVWAGDSVFVGRESDIGIDYACQWFQLPNDTIPIDTIAGMWVKPTSNTTYVVRQQLWCSGVKWDTVRVHMLSVGLEEDIARQFEIYPNPVLEEIRIRSSGAGVSFSVVVSDVSGKVLCQRYETAATGELQLNVAWPDGLYFVQIKTPQGALTRKVVVQR